MKCFCFWTNSSYMKSWECSVCETSSFRQNHSPVSHTEHNQVRGKEKNLLAQTNKHRGLTRNLGRFLSKKIPSFDKGSLVLLCPIVMVSQVPPMLCIELAWLTARHVEVSREVNADKRPSGRPHKSSVPLTTRCVCRWTKWSAGFPFNTVIPAILYEHANSLLRNWSAHWATHFRQQRKVLGGSRIELQCRKEYNITYWTDICNHNGTCDHAMAQVTPLKYPNDCNTYLR